MSFASYYLDNQSDQRQVVVCQFNLLQRLRTLLPLVSALLVLSLWSSLPARSRFDSPAETTPEAVGTHSGQRLGPTGSQQPQTPKTPNPLTTEAQNPSTLGSRVSQVRTGTVNPRCACASLQGTRDKAQGFRIAFGLMILGCWCVGELWASI